MKTIWKGSIAFGLVSIPIRLYSATESHALGFTLLHSKCHTPVKYHRWCPKCDKEIEWNETVKGLKKDTGEYLTITQENLKKLKPEKTEAIKIIEFVDYDAVDVIYFNNHYYITPNKEDDTAYALFVKSLENLKKVAIGKFVMRDKEHICMLQPYNNYLLLTTLHYMYEIKGIKDLAFTKKVKIDAKELKLAKTFIEKLSVKKFDMSKFKDTLAQELKKLLKNKAKKVKEVKFTPRTKKRSLIESLNASLEQVVPKKTNRDTIHANRK